MVVYHSILRLPVGLRKGGLGFRVGFRVGFPHVQILMDSQAIFSKIQKRPFFVYGLGTRKEDTQFAAELALFFIFERNRETLKPIDRQNLSVP